ncbi:hypothetical protein ACHAW5_006091 [Stephanodiscus triporus]|uniref:Uncharacterized protein n=1 Tax=Stephanodiscus triporus TaxID=2934178 RepID=A0ABD3MTM1_9STRA
MMVKNYDDTKENADHSFSSKSFKFSDNAHRLTVEMNIPSFSSYSVSNMGNDDITITSSGSSTLNSAGLEKLVKGKKMEDENHKGAEVEPAAPERFENKVKVETNVISAVEDEENREVTAGLGKKYATYDNDRPVQKTNGNIITASTNITTHVVKKKNPLASYVERQNRTTSSSINSPCDMGNTSTITSKMMVDTVAASGSYDYSSSSESLIYSLGDTVKSGDPLGDLTAFITDASEMLKDVDNEIGSGFAQRDGGVQTSNSNLSSTRLSADAITDLVASTLAECRLLLEMSPPPTPYGEHGHDGFGFSAVYTRGERRFDGRTTDAHQPDERPYSQSWLQQARCAINEEGNKDNYGCTLAMSGRTGGSPYSSSSSSTTSIVSTSTFTNILTCDEVGINSTRKTNMDGKSTEKDQCHPIRIGDETSINNKVEEHHQQQRENMSFLKSSSRSSGSSGGDNDYQEEPSTPVSRAEYRILQRREKLIQSLEKVNRILEKSTGNRQRPQVEEMPTNQTMTTSERTSVNGASNSENNYIMVAQKSSRRKMELRVDTEANTSSSSSGPQNQTAASHAEVLVAASDKDSEEILMIDDGGISVSISSTHKPTTCTMQRLECISSDPPSFAANIFRADCGYHGEGTSAPELIEFGHVQSMSQESSLTDNNDDTLFLLADNRTMQSPADEKSTASSSKVRLHAKVKDHGLNNAIKGGLQTWQGKERQQMCPQFLPSLKYSTMQEHDVFADDNIVGLVTNNDNDFHRSPVWGTKQVAAPSSERGVKQATRMNNSGKFIKKLFTQSFDDGFSRHVEFHDQVNACNTIERSVSHAREEEQRDDKMSGPTYDFSLHSCSMSPSSSNDDQCWLKSGQPQHHRLGDGSLVTHKPRRLHIKILNTLRGGMKKSRKNVT